MPQEPFTPRKRIDPRCTATLKVEYYIDHDEEFEDLEEA
jgi:hypothetical protein